jgi:putative tricarboxylic transport membrane protein
VNKGNSPRLDSGRIAELVVAIGLTLIGAVVLWKTGDIRITPMNSRIGPRVIPYIVGSGLVVVGIWYVIEVLRGHEATPTGGEDSEDVDPTLPTDWGTIGIIAISLIAYLLLIERAGFIVASSVLFLGSASGMGSRKVPRDAVIAVVLSTAIYLIFTRGLSLDLPEGVIPLEMIALVR